MDQRGAKQLIFCLENICETLGLDPEYVRRGLFRSKIAQSLSCHAA